MNNLDAAILAVLQDDFPLQTRPYRVLADRLQSTERTIFARVEHMVAQGIIRRLGPRYDARRLGRRGTLVAAGVPPERLETVADVLEGYHQVTHCYERAGGPYNLWFTLTAGPAESPDALMEEIRGKTGIEDMYSLPAERVYKLRVRFQPGENERDQTRSRDVAMPSPSEDVRPLDDVDRRIVSLTQGGLPVSIAPFQELADRLALSSDELLGRLGRLAQDGFIRTMGAVVHGPSVGFRCNMLVAWRVEPAECDRVGAIFASFSGVSHCYQRRALAEFPYNVYTMIHGRDRADCLSLLASMAGQSGVSERVSLETVRELKKTAPRFF